MNVSIVFHLPCKKVVVWDAFLSNFARTEIGARAAKIEPPRMSYVPPRLMAVLFRNCSLVIPEVLRKTETWPKFNITKSSSHIDKTR